MDDPFPTELGVDKEKIRAWLESCKRRHEKTAGIDMLAHRDYLGDGVYCGFDGLQVWLWISDGIRIETPIAMEEHTLNNLIAYARKHYTSLERPGE